MQRFLAGRTVGFALSTIIVAGIAFSTPCASCESNHRCTHASSRNSSSFGGLGNVVSVFMSVVAMLVFNYAFLPPVGNLTIADPQNWVALGAFLVTSIMGSQLSARIRKEADEAHSRRREIERLYKFSQKLLGEGNVIQLMNAIPNYIVESFEAGAAELFLPQKAKFYRSGMGLLISMKRK